MAAQADNKLYAVYEGHKQIALCRHRIDAIKLRNRIQDNGGLATYELIPERLADRELLWSLRQMEHENTNTNKSTK